MKTRQSFPILAPALLGLCCLVSSCDKKPEADMSSPAPPQPRYSPSPPAAPSELQAQMLALRGVPYEHEPAKRPLVISKRIQNPKDWLIAALKDGYQQSAHTNAQWDTEMDAVLRAYAEYSRVAADERHFEELTNAILAAVAKGSDDPMLQYMRVRYDLVRSNQTQQQFALASLQAFRSMLLSQYHPFLKFMAGFRAVGAAREAEPKGDRSVPIGYTTACLEDIARDTNAPASEVFSAVTMWLDHTGGWGWVAYVMSNLEDLLKQTWGRDEAFYRLRGDAEVARAWQARGDGFADSVTDKGWQQFVSHLNQATLALETSWQMNPSNAFTAYLMMQVELGQGQGRPRMEKWFNRAMAVAPSYYDAADLMAFYLQPRWYGSDEEALAFARSCVASTDWRGRVPLVLADLHHSLATYHELKDSPQYWQRPGVWDDVRSSYERFFELNPNQVGYRHNYARDAYLCGHYQEFLAQARLFPSTNLQYFGGEAEFQKMVARAAATKP